MTRLLLRIWKILCRVPGLQTLMLHMVNARFIVGASAVIMDGEGRVLLFHHTYRPKHAWGLPGGFLKRGENAPITLTREVAEESGMAIDVDAPLAIETSRRGAMIETIYLARFVGGEFRASPEVDRCEWFTKDLPEDLKPLQRRVVEEARRLREEDRLPPRNHA